MTTVAEAEIASEREKLYGRLYHTDDDSDGEDEEQNVPTTSNVTVSRKRKRHAN